MIPNSISGLGWRMQRAPTEWVGLPGPLRIEVEQPVKVLHVYDYQTCQTSCEQGGLLGPFQHAPRPGRGIALVDDGDTGQWPDGSGPRIPRLRLRRTSGAAAAGGPCFAV
jgi:hypothetical protein